MIKIPGVYRKYLTHPFTFIVAIGLLLRFVIIFAYQIPVFEPDSYSYIELASYIIKGKLFEYQGWRTPGYPIMLFISFGKHYMMVILIQSILDIVTSYFLYDLIKKHLPKFAFLITLFFYTLIKVILYEVNILTESPTLFALTFSIWLILKYEAVSLCANYKLTLIISLVLTYCFFLRPMFIYVPFVLGFFMTFNIKKQHILTHVTKVLIVIILPFSAYIAWCTLNLVNNNWFTVTTYSGINLAQTSVKFFHNADDEHKVIRDIYQKHIDDSKEILDKKMVHKGNNPIQRIGKNMDFESIEALSIWRAYGELIEKTKMTRPELSYQLNIISKDLIKEHPKEYLHQVAKSWLFFWIHKDIPIKDDYIINREIIDSYRVLLGIQKYILSILNLLLIPSIILILNNSVQKKKLFSSNNFLWTIILTGSFLQAIVTYGGNSRFFFPFIPIALILIGRAVSILNQKFAMKKGT